MYKSAIPITNVYVYVHACVYHINIQYTVYCIYIQLTYMCYRCCSSDMYRWSEC